MSAATIKEELERRAAALEKELETVIERVKTTNPTEARILQIEEQELKRLSGALALAQLPLLVAALERRLNELEIRVAIQLQRIEGPSTGSTSLPTTGSTTPPPTRTPSPTKTPTLTTQTLTPSTQRPTPPTQPTSTGSTASSTTLSPDQLKDALVKRATLLESSLQSELDKLTKDNRTEIAAPLEKMKDEINSLLAKLAQCNVPKIISILISELNNLEERLSIQLKLLIDHDNRIEKLLISAMDLKQKITQILISSKDQIISTALKQLLDSLGKLSLYNSDDDKTVDDFELQLAFIRERFETIISHKN